MFTATLPYPLTTNSLFINSGKRRRRSERYDAWIAAGTAALIEQRHSPVKGRFTAHIVLRAPDRRARDLDNTVKCQMDLLKKLGLIEDDSLCRRLLVEWSDQAPDGKGASTITIRETE